MRRGRRAGAAVALGAWLLLACEPAAIRPEDAVDARRTLLAWFECEECWSGELDAVAALGERAVPMLAATLEAGLSPASRARLEGQLVAYYDAARDAAPPGWSRDEFVAHHLGNRDASYRSRAAVALGRIGGREAEQALRSALDRAQPPGVEQAIRAALADLEGRAGAEP